MKLWFFGHCLFLKRGEFIWLKCINKKEIALKMHILSNIIRFELIKIAKFSLSQVSKEGNIQN